MGWLIIAIIAFVAIGYFGLKKQNRENTERVDALVAQVKAIPDFCPTRTIIGVKGMYAFAIDSEREKILICCGDGNKIIPHEQIISVELTEGNTIMLKKSTARVLGGGILGGFIAGEAGAVVGGLSGDMRQEKKVSGVYVKLRLRDIQAPSFVINCFDSKTMTIAGKKEIKTKGTESELYHQGLADAKEITDIVSVVIDSVDKKQTSSDLTSTQNLSVADELGKLLDLKDKGIISEGEFIEQKQKLLRP